jgi:hypothetical protein
MLKCCNRVRNAETPHLMHEVRDLSIVVVQLGAVKIYVAASGGGAEENGKTG